MYTAIIPVKGNSSRLPKKNIKEFGDLNLLTRKIKQVKDSNIADRIVVSSDDDEMLDIAIKNGVEAIKRPYDLANETRPLSDFFSYICSIVDKGNLIWACVTSPFFDEWNMIEAKKKYELAIKENYDSLITVYKFKHYLMNDDGPMNYKLGEAHSNSQDLPSYDLFTNGILIAPIKSVRKWKYNYGPKAYRYEVDQKTSIDIDTKLDYLAALSWLDEK